MEHLLLLLLLHERRILLYGHPTVLAIVANVGESGTTHHGKVAWTVLTITMGVPVCPLLALEGLLLGCVELCGIVLVHVLQQRAP